MTDHIFKTDHGAILYDNTIIKNITENLFLPHSWPDVKLISNDIGGRGEIYFLGDGKHTFVLRHYNRGGMIRRFMKDSYVWKDEERTRSFSEWYLLKKLYAMNLPVPMPVAANYIKSGFFYKANILTMEIPEVKSLARYMIESEYFENFWPKIGAHIQSFHRVGLCHADLNAHNIQIDKDRKMWLLDFDKSCILKPGKWQNSNLSRLKRSIQKIKDQNLNVSFSSDDWEALKKSYIHSSRLA